MFNSSAFLQEIMEQPGAVLIAEELQTQLKTEQQRRQEFYQIMDDKDKVEFINGEIVYHSPVVKEHNEATKHLLQLMNVFVMIFRLGFVGVEKILTQFTRNDYEPDLCFFKKEKADFFTNRQMFFPVPDLAVEVLSKDPKSVRRDRTIKYNDYELHGVAEYWLIDPEDKTVEQYFLEDGKYRLALKSGEGMIRSRVVEGFAIPIRAIFDEETNLAVLREMLK